MQESLQIFLPIKTAIDGLKKKTKTLSEVIWVTVGVSEKAILQIFSVWPLQFWVLP